MIHRPLVLIGCGSIGRRHAKILRDLGVRDIRLVDAETMRAEALANETGFRAATFDSAFDPPAPMAALVCVPTGRLVPTAQACLARGVHLFVEKPVAAFSEEAVPLVAQAAAAGRILMVGYNLRFQPLLDETRARLGAGAVGHVRAARFWYSDHLPSRHPEEDYRTRYEARSAEGGGVLLDLAHEIDLAARLLGPFAEVRGWAGRTGALSIEAEDWIDFSVRFASGIRGAFHFDFLRRPSERGFEIVGDSGTLRADLRASRLEQWNGAGGWNEVAHGIPHAETYRRELAAFLSALDGGPPPPVGGERAIEILQWIDLVRNAAK